MKNKKIKYTPNPKYTKNTKITVNKSCHIFDDDLETVLGTLHHCCGCSNIFMEQLDENGNKTDTIKLAPGTAMKVQIGGEWHQAILYYAEHNGKLEWSLNGDVNISGEEIDGLTVRVPLYLEIERCDGMKYHLYNFSEIPDSSCCIGHYGYKYFEMSAKEVAWMYIDIVIKMCLDNTDQWVYGSYLEHVLENADYDNKIVEMTKKVFSERYILSHEYEYEARKRLIIQWVDEIAEYANIQKLAKESSSDISEI